MDHNTEKKPSQSDDSKSYEPFCYFTISVLAGLGSALTGSAIWIFYNILRERARADWREGIIVVIASAVVILIVAIVLAYPLLLGFRKASNGIWITLSLSSGCIIAFIIAAIWKPNGFAKLVGLIELYASIFGVLTILLRKPICARLGSE